MNKIILLVTLLYPMTLIAQIECKNDAETLCKEFSGRSERISCLLLKKDKIKDLACRTRISNKVQEAYDICLDDYFKFCEKRYPSSLSSAYNCLIRHKSSLKQECQMLLPTN